MGDEVRRALKNEVKAMLMALRDPTETAAHIWRATAGWPLRRQGWGGFRWDVRPMSLPLKSSDFDSTEKAFARPNSMLARVRTQSAT